MNLIIDIGNSRTKFWLFNQNYEVESAYVGELQLIHIDNVLAKHESLDKVILSTVKDYPEDLKIHLKKNFKKFIELDEHTPLPVKNNYLTKRTLGKDRIAAAAGAAYLYPGRNVLVIDAGTAITYDFIDERNGYMGGNISPGLEMRYKALNLFTNKLPLLEADEFNGFLGQSTHDAIHAGIQKGLLYEVDGVINAFKENYRNLCVIITGGNDNFFDKKLKNSFFVHYNIIAIGLNSILEYNGEI